MSDAEPADDGPGRREVAYRLFAAEFDDANLEHAESDRERAPNYVITPTGGRVNRVFVVGVLTEVEPVSDEVLRARVVDPSGAFVLYAGQYQPDERAFLDRADPPAFVAVTGKARTFQPEDSDRIFTSVRPESVNDVDAETRDRWTVDATERTLDRVEAMATALALGATGDDLREALEERGIEEGLATGISLALDHYGTTATYLAAVRDLAIEAARHVAGDVDEVAPLETAPAAAGDVTPADLLDAEVEPLESRVDADETTSPEPAGDSAGQAETATETPAAVEGESTGGGESIAGDAPENTAGSGETADDPGPGDFETGDFEIDTEEREAIEEEYGTEFQAGTEVDEPGEADIETPEPTAEPAPATESGAGDSPEEPDPAGSDDAVAEGGDPAEGDEPDGSEAAPVEDVALPDVAVEAMEELDEGDGADRSAVIAAVVERTEADSEAVEEAVQEALMDGRCYEPDDGTLKPI